MTLKTLALPLAPLIGALIVQVGVLVTVVNPGSVLAGVFAWALFASLLGVPSFYLPMLCSLFAMIAIEQGLRERQPALFLICGPLAPMLVVYWLAGSTQPPPPAHVLNAVLAWAALSGFAMGAAYLLISGPDRLNAPSKS